MNKVILFETEKFIVFTTDKPHVSRTDGGHITVEPKTTVEDRTKLLLADGEEMMKLTMIAGEAMRNALTARGVEIGRINYQDNGNWRPELHIHLYGRAKNAVVQKWGTPLKFPATGEEQKLLSLEPLNDGDISAIQTEIERLMETDKYRK